MSLPIRIRLAAVYSAVFLVVIGLLAGGTYASVRAAVQTIVDHELDTRLAGLDDHLARHIGRLTWPELADSLQTHSAFQPALLRISEPTGTVLLDGTALAGASPLSFQATPRIVTLASGAKSLRVLTVRRTIQGRPYDLALATDLLIPGAILARLWLVLLLSLPVVMLAASWAGYWISGRALAPVSGIIAAAHAIDATRLGARLVLPATGDEIEQLATTINGMLDRIEDGFGHVRQFTADASHELRTPVAIIRAAAEVALLNRAADERAHRESLQRILREAEDASLLLEDLLYLARADARAELEVHAPCDLGRQLLRACAQVGPLADSKGVVVVCQALPSTVWIDGDDDQLRRLWLNLLDNALKYTPRGGCVSVSIGTTREGRPFCDVADTGVGIAPEHLPRLFERFYRVEPSRTRSRGGTGLGLAIAKKIVSLHAASIEVISEPSQGSVFRVTFPERHAVVMAHAS